MIEKINSRLISQALILSIPLSNLFTTVNASAKPSEHENSGEIDRFIQETMRPITALPELAYTPIPVPANPPPGLYEYDTSHFLEPFAPMFPSTLLPAHGRATCVRVNS